MEVTLNIKVMLADDHVLMREGIRQLLEFDGSIEVIGEASDGELALPMILEKKPDILITDIKMPFMDGLELSEQVKKVLPATKIMILSGYRCNRLPSEANFFRKIVGCS